MEGIKEELIDKRIFVILKSGRQYNGVVKSVKDNLVSIIDKFGELVIFSTSEISSVEIK